MNLANVVTTLYGEATCQTGTGAGSISWRFEGHWNAATTKLGSFTAPPEADADSALVHNSVNSNLVLQGAIDTANKLPLLQLSTGGTTGNSWSCTADATAIESD